jgi:hypothetical protein
MNKNEVCNENSTPYNCHFAVKDQQLEFAPNIIEIKEDDCICKALAAVMSTLSDSKVKEVYITFEKPEKDMDVVFIDIWKQSPDSCIKSSFHRKANSTDLAIVMGILGSRSPRKMMDNFDNSKYTATLRIELVSIV